MIYGEKGFRGYGRLVKYSYRYRDVVGNIAEGWGLGVRSWWLGVNGLVVRGQRVGG